MVYWMLSCICPLRTNGTYLSFQSSVLTKMIWQPELGAVMLLLWHSGVRGRTRTRTRGGDRCNVCGEGPEHAIHEARAYQELECIALASPSSFWKYTLSNTAGALNFCLKMSTAIQENLVASNEQYASSFTEGKLALPPAKKYLVGTHTA